MRRAALSALWSHWRRHPVQLVTFIAGLALATGLWSAVQAINGEARANYAEAARQLGAAGGEILTPRSGTIPVATYVALRRAGWQVSPVLEGRARLGGAWVTVMGVDPLNHPVLPALSEAGGSPLDALRPPGRLFARTELAETLAAAPDLPPVTATTRLPPGTVLTDIATAETLLDAPGQVTRLILLPRQPLGRPPLSEIAPDLVRRAAPGAGDADRLTDSFHLNLTAFGFLSFAVGLFIVHGAVGLAFEERRGLIRTLRALGLPVRVLIALVLGELLALALLGGLLGLVLGYLVAAALLPDVAATLRGLYGAPVTGGLALRADWVAAGLGMAVLGALAASAQGLNRLIRMPLLSASGNRAWSVLSARGLRRQALAGLALFGLGALALAVSEGLVAGFALLAGLMLGAALILPAILDAVLRLGAGRARGPLGEWFWADLRAQLSGLSLAQMALLLALAANIGVGTMVSSFRLTFTGWLDQRLASELYVTARDDAQGAALADWLAPRVDAVLPLRSSTLGLDGAPVEAYGVVDHATYRDHWPLIAHTDDVWDRIAAGEAILVNEQLARRDGLWPGDSVTLARDRTLPVAGVYSDYGNPTGQIILSLDLLARLDPEMPNRQFGIRITPDRAAALAGELRAAFDLPVVDQGAIKAQSLAIFDKTFVVTGALNILTLGVAGFAILTSLLTLWNARLPQLAPVWALGLPRAALARAELGRSLALAALTALCALPLGLALAWVLLAVINVEAFGWRLPMHLFPLDWLRLFALALLAALAAAILPALRLRRVPPSDLLKVFANER